MARKKEETKTVEFQSESDVILDDDAINKEELIEIPREAPQQWEEKPNLNPSDGKGLINCLRNERVIIKHVDKQTGMIRDPRHVLYGGMSENAKKTYTVPLLKSGTFVNVLTKDEKDYLEYVLGLEPNALGIYNKVNNFWSTANPNGISTVTLEKRNNQLDLSKPIDYIKYKILLANKDRIAPSISALQNSPKATYEFVIVAENDVNKDATTKMNYRKQAYKIFGKLEDNPDVLKLIIETIDGRPISANTKLEALQTKIDDIIQRNAQLFVNVANDKYLDVKVLINKALDAGIISRRGTYYYLRENNQPLCENGQEPNFNIAAAYLGSPKRQALKFSIETKINQS